MFNRKTAVLLALTSELVIVELALIYAGSWFDQNKGWGGYGVILGAFLGLLGWVTHLIIVLREPEEDEP